MMKQIILVFLFLVSLSAFSQEKSKNSYADYKVVCNFQDGEYCKGLFKGEEMILPTLFGIISSIDSAGLVMVSIEGKSGLYSIRKRKWIFSLVLSRIEKVNKELYIISKEDKKGVYSNSGNWIIDCDFEDIWFDDQLDVFTAFGNNQYSIFSKKGKVLNQETCKKIEKIRSDSSMFLVRNNSDKLGIINSKGTIKVPFDYSYFVSLFHIDNMFIALNSNNKYGIVNANNEILIDFKFDFIDINLDDLLRTFIKDKKGCLIIDRTNNTIREEVLPIYDFFDTKDILWNGTYSFLKYSNSAGFKLNILEKGVVIESEHDFMLIDVFNEKYVLTEKGGKTIIYNLEGEIIHSLEVDSFLSNQDDYLILLKKGKFGLYSFSQNKILLPFKYESMFFSLENIIYEDKGEFYSSSLDKLNESLKIQETLKKDDEKEPLFLFIEE